MALKKSIKLLLDTLKTSIKGDQVRLSSNQKDLESVYYTSAQKTLEKLNAISPSFCLAKWYQVSLHLPNARTHSCYHPPTHKISAQEVENQPSALHNTKYKILQRQSMLEGQRPEECSYCWKMEDQGHISDRAYRSADIFSDDLLLQVQADINSATPRYLEVNFNSSCNFKCVYCSPHLSSSWRREVEGMGPFYLLSGTHNDIQGLKKADMMPESDENKLMSEAFWKWWPEVYTQLKFFRMTGGEPLLDHNTYKVFQYIENNPHPNLQLAITSNVCPPPDQWQKFLKHLNQLTDKNTVDHFMLFCSLDSWGKANEFIRNGMNFSGLQENIREFLSKPHRKSLSFIITTTNLSIFGLPDLIKYILSLRQEFNSDRQLIWFDTPILDKPSWLSLQTLPKHYVKYIDESLEFMKQNLEGVNNRFKGFKDYEVAKLERLKSCMLQEMNQKDLMLQRSNFFLFVKELERRRFQNLVEFIPEAKEFLDLCVPLQQDFQPHA